MDITTIEYLNLPTYRNNNLDSDSDFMDDNEDDDDDIDYDSDYYYSEAYSWKETSPKPHHKWAIYRLYRMVVHRLRRAWIVTLRAVIPNYRYRRLKNSKRRACCCSISSNKSKKPHLLPTASHSSLKNQSRFKKKTHDNVNMEEFFETRTIRPIITSNEEEEEPDYDDDMGLDLTILNEEEEWKEQETNSKKRTSSNKLARLLDMSEEDTLMRIQQEKQQHQPNQLLAPMDLPNEENALSEL